MDKNTVIIKKARDLFDLLDRYLIADLKTMIFEVHQRPAGGLGYPAIHSLIAGMELLGMIISGKDQQPAFDFFWQNHLSRNFPEYNDADLQTVFYNAIRNGTAHIFLIKQHVSLSKDKMNHLAPVMIGPSQYLNIDLILLYEHFKKCYEEIKSKILEAKEKTVLIEFKHGFNQLERQMEGEPQLIKNIIKKKISDGPYNYPGANGSRTDSFNTASFRIDRPHTSASNIPYIDPKNFTRPYNFDEE